MNRALRGAYNKGLAAGLAGEPESVCPYEDKRKWNGRLTWSRAFATAWRDGWQVGAEKAAERYLVVGLTEEGEELRRITVVAAKLQEAKDVFMGFSDWICVYKFEADGSLTKQEDR